MAGNWTKVAVDVGTGGVAGVADQLVQNLDENRALAERATGALAADKKLPIMKQYGTYLNYGAPLLAVIASAMGWIRGDMETRLVTAGGQLAGRKATHHFTTGATSKSPSAAYTAWARQAAAAEAARRGGATRTYEGEFNKAAIL
jgi:hypothetical protein